MFKRVLILSTIVLIRIAPCFALFLLDDVMNKETQQKTGVAKLTHNQKIALENWLNQNFELKTTKQENKEPQLFLSINIDAGRKLQLSDGSIWEVSPVDVAQASIWITPFPLRIVPGTDPNYPYLIVNKISGISVNARPTAPAAETPPPQPGPVIFPAETEAPQSGQTSPQGTTGASGQVTPSPQMTPPGTTITPPQPGKPKP